MTERRQPRKLEEYALSYYSALAALSDLKEIDGMDLLVFEGKLTDVFTAAVGNPAYYTKIRSILVKTGSIEIIQQGNRGAPSVVVLHHKPPDCKDWPEDLTGVLPAATILLEADRRLAALEAWRESITIGGLNIGEALRNMETRLSKLEAKNGKK